MNKRIIALLFALIIIAALFPMEAGAAVTGNPRVIDKADVLTSEQEATLTSKLNDYSSNNDCDIVFLTEPDMEHENYSFNGSVEDFADMYYETNGYASDGVLVLVLLDNGSGSRRVQFSCSGKCMKRLKDDEQNDIIDDVYSSLKSSDYYSALSTIADEINSKLPPQLEGYKLPLAIVLGILLAFIIMSSLKRKLKSVAMQRGAASYVRDGSMAITASRDTYLYSTVSRTVRQSSSSSGSGRTSSGGGSHSGVGRNF